MAYREVINDKISPDENLMHTALTNLKNLLMQCGCGMDIYVTTFNFTIADSHPLLDTLFSSAYYIKNYVDNMDMVKSMYYWKLNDDIETKSIGEAFSASMCIWLGHASASIISTFFSRQSLRIISPISFFICLYTICRLYLGANTMWYLHLYVECAV